MRVSEKSLELNVAAEILAILRQRTPRAYLRGLTQAEESAEGVDVFAQLDPSISVYAFQFKAPKNTTDATPYRFKVQREQHELLFDLSQSRADSVFYVFPCYVSPQRVYDFAPKLLRNTTMCPLEWLSPDDVFGDDDSTTLRCTDNTVSVNPDYHAYDVTRFRQVLNHSEGIPVKAFTEWYVQFSKQKSDETGKRSPWLARGLRVVIAQRRE